MRETGEKILRLVSAQLALPLQKMFVGTEFSRKMYRGKSVQRRYFYSVNLQLFFKFYS